MPLPLTYNLRNLWVRRLSSSFTFVVIGVVVFVLAVLLSFAEGIRASLIANGRSDNVLVLKPGATAESTSIILPQEAARLVQAPGIAKDARGYPMVSREVSVQTSLQRLTQPGLKANVAVRGVDPAAFDVHPEVRLVEGRLFEMGKLEAIVGRAAAQRYAGLSIGDGIILGRSGNRSYRVVGVFEAAGGSFESEIWAPRTMVQDSYGRKFISSAVVRIAPDADPEAAIDYINGPAVELDAKRETTYYDELTRKTTEIVVLASMLVGIMAIGAAFAVANTMYAAVDARRREIAMLRTIGFSRGSIILSFVVESMLLSAFACTAGLAASLLLNGVRQDFLSDTTWTVLAYELRVTPQVMLTAVALAGGVGLVGALAPAIRASRVQAVWALRRG